jgi:hypothetical protein
MSTAIHLAVSVTKKRKAGSMAEEIVPALGTSPVASLKESDQGPKKDDKQPLIT